ncbi:MAG: SulP family inorganic anion transporter [Bryobacterales bacterium]|nr:SulP family inorganic anion transporter [Bryobacterales bacterium]
MQAKHVDSIQPSLETLTRYDGPAGLVVFLVALPLCLGIALASGAPLFSGVIAGLVGGTVVAALSGSQVSVSGPAAGLAVIVAAAIQSFGSFPVFLMSVLLAGGMQIVLGMLKLGVIGDYVPNAVIKGMLAGIGLVIILKQIPHALGRDKDFEGDLAFLEGKENTLTDIVEAMMSASPGAILVTAVSLIILFSWDSLAARLGGVLKLVPASLLVVAAGIGLNQALGTLAPAIQIREPEHMVALPVASSLGQFFQQFTLPDFTAIANPKVWSTALTIAIVASIETLLSLEAADRLDPYKRISPPNRELIAQGCGNVASGLIGGLPITSVVVRTSANVYAGARTWMASLVHGLMLFAAALLIPTLLNLTPLACLAAILMLVGYKLTKISLYQRMFAMGWSQFLPFTVTVLAIVFTDLLTGVLVGLAIGLFFVIQRNHHDAFTVVNQDHHYLMRFNKDATFVNKSELRTKLREIPPGAHLMIDGIRALYIDRDVLEVVEDFQLMAPYKDITVVVENLE